MKKRIEKTTWNEIKDRVKRLNYDLYEVIDELNPTDELFILRYKYGEKISDSKYFYKPKSDHGYDLIKDSEYPSFITLDKNLELFFDASNGIYPEYIYETGTLIPMTISSATNEYSARPPSPFTLTSGLRSIVSLPMGCESKAYYEMLRYYNIDDVSSPAIISGHFEVFREIANKEKINWQSEILLLPKSWDDKIQNDPKWYKFKLYKYHIASKTNVYKYNSFYLSNVMTEIAEDKKIKMRSMSFELAQKILLVATGDFVGYKPLNDNFGFPLTDLTEIFFNKYNKNAVPIFMGSAMNKYDGNQIYMPLMSMIKTLPNQTKYYPYMVDICTYMPIFLKEFTKKTLSIGTIYSLMFKKLELMYYGERGNQKYGISEIGDIIKNDNRFFELHEEYKTRVNLGITKRNPFLRNLVSINLK